MAEQALIDGVATDLMKASQEYVEAHVKMLAVKNDAKMQINELKGKLTTAEGMILIEMKKENRELYTAKVGTKNYQFTIEDKKKLKCVEQTPLPLTDTPAVQE